MLYLDLTDPLKYFYGARIDWQKCYVGAAMYVIYILMEWMEDGGKIFEVQRGPLLSGDRKQMVLPPLPPLLI